MLPPARSPLRLALTASLLLVSSGCFRYHTHVPGVVDMRTDGSAAEPRKPRLQRAERDASVAVFIGRGVHRARDRVVVEERHYWVGGLIPLLNTSAADEVALALGHSHGLRDFELSEEIGFSEGLVANAVPLVLPVSSYVLPSFTFTASGIAVEPATGMSAPPSRTRRGPPGAGRPSAEPPLPEASDAAPPPPPALLDLEDAGATK